MSKRRFVISYTVEGHTYYAASRGTAIRLAHDTVDAELFGNMAQVKKTLTRFHYQVTNGGRYPLVPGHMLMKDGRKWLDVPQLFQAICDQITNKTAVVSEIRLEFNILSNTEMSELC